MGEPSTSRSGAQSALREGRLERDRGVGERGAVAKALWIALALVIVYSISRHLVYEPWTRDPVDFQVYYRAAQRAMIGESPYRPFDARTTATAYYYPLFGLAPVTPLVNLSEFSAGTVWWIGNVLLVLGGAWAAGRYVSRWPSHLRTSSGERSSGSLSRLGVAGLCGAAVVVAALPVAKTVHLGQYNVIVASLVAVSLWLCALERRVWAGAVFALAVLIKAQPILLLPAMAPALGVAGLLAVVAVGAVYLCALRLTGLWEWEWTFWTETAPESARWAEHPTISIYRQLTRSGLEVETARDAAFAIEGLIVLVMLAGVVALWRLRVSPTRIAAWGVVCVLPMSRALEDHHFAILCVPVVVLLGESERTGARFPLGAALTAFALVNLGHIVGDRHASNLSAATALYMAGALACGVGIVAGAFAHAPPDNSAGGTNSEMGRGVRR